MAEKSAEKAIEKTANEIQKAVDEAEKQGFYGVKADPRPNSEYSLESGPESPGHVDDIHTRTAQIGVNRNA